jgi:hypothetical protein
MSTKMTLLCGGDPDYHLYKEMTDWDEKKNSARVYLSVRDNDGRDIIDAPIEFIRIENGKVKVEMEVICPKK